MSKSRRRKHQQALARLSLSSRARKVCKALGLKTVGDLQARSPDELLAVPGCGERTCNELIHAVSKAGAKSLTPAADPVPNGAVGKANGAAGKAEGAKGKANGAPGKATPAKIKVTMAKIMPTEAETQPTAGETKLTVPEGLGGGRPAGVAEPPPRRAGVPHRGDHHGRGVS